MTRVVKKTAAGLVAVLLLLPTESPAQQQTQTEAAPKPLSAKALARDDKRIVAARRYFLKDHRRSFEKSARAISEGSVYQPLVGYWRAVIELRRNRTAALAEFIAASESPYLREAGRRQLLEYYARKKLWKPFARYAIEPGAPLCAKLQANFSNSLPEILNQWRKDNKIGDPLCAALYRYAHKQKLITEKMAWEKIRDLAGDKQLSASRRLMRVFPGLHRYATLRKVANRAQRHLRAKHSLATRRNRELVMISAAASARGRPSLAIARWAKFSPYFSAEENAHVYIKIAEWAARWRRDDALSFYRLADKYAAQAKTRPHIYDENARAWRTRAALLAGDYNEALAVIETMPAEENQLSAWRYWQAVALQKRGGDDGVKGGALMMQLAKDEDDFYGLLARQASGLPLMNGGANNNNANKQTTARGDYALAMALHRAGLSEFGRKVWRAAVRREGADKSEAIAAARLAAERGWYLASVDAAEYFRGPRELRFPTPFAGEVMKYSRRFGLDPAFVYGLIRQESRFMPKIKSSAGARGLMQIIPRTARQIARKHGYGRYRLPRLTRVDTNVILGTTYLSDLAKLLKNRPPLIAAGYNAGPRRPLRWRREGPQDAQWQVFIENIPITETRLYVKYVLANRAHYDAVFSRTAGEQEWITRPITETKTASR